MSAPRWDFPHITSVVYTEPLRSVGGKYILATDHDREVAEIWEAVDAALRDLRISGYHRADEFRAQARDAIAALRMTPASAATETTTP